MLARSLAGLSLAVALVATTGCMGGDADPSQGASSNAAITGPSTAAATLEVDSVNAVITKLNQQRTGDPIGPYYADGSRLEGCWRNPAGSKLTDLKKAFYCSMPLEFRLCNTVVLLTSDDSQVDQRYQGYLDCQTKVDSAFGNQGIFVYDDDTNAMYKQLFLTGALLPDDDTAAVIAANKPAFTDRSFPVILLAIGASLLKEASDLAWTALTSMADSYRSTSDTDPR